MAFRIQLPTRAQLTPEQRMVIDSDYEECSTVMLTGCPGSGKTVASAYRVIDRCVSKKKPALMLTYHNLLAVALRNTFQESAVDGNVVQTVMRWFYNQTRQLLRPNGNRNDENDEGGGWLNGHQISQALGQQQHADCELFIDEGQDLPISIFESLPKVFKRTFITADKAQMVHEFGADPEEIEPVLQKSGEHKKVIFQYNYRNSYEVFNFARQFVPNDRRANDDFTLRELARRRGQSVANKPNVYVFTESAQRDAQMKTLLANVLGVRHVRETVGILFSRANDVDSMHEAVCQWGYSATKYHSGAECPTDLENCVVTTYKSAKGLEFNHVIIPQLNLGDLSEEQWFVACTRAMNALHVFCRGSLPRMVRGFNVDSYKRQELI